MTLNENLQSLWNVPKPLRSDKSSLPPFPVSCLPIVPQAMAVGIAKSTSTDVAMAGTAILSALSHCFSGVYRMEGKPDHIEPITLYSLTLAEPSERKSPVMKLVKEPYVMFANDYNNANRERIYLSQEERNKQSAEIERMQKTENVTAEEIAKKKAELDKTPCACFKRVCVDDVTPEALVGLLHENKTMLMISAEAGVFKNFGGRYCNGIPNLDLFLKCWGGESYQKDRCNASPIYLSHPYLSICLCGQPYILGELFANQAFRASGMIARFLYCFPKSKVGSRKYETETVNEKFTESYNKLVYSVLNFKYSRQSDEEKILYFTAEAKAEFAKYYDTAIEPKLLTDFAECQDWGGKYHGLILRLCGLLHCIKCVQDNVPPESREVELLTLGQAIDIAEYYKQQARYAYGIMGADSVTDDAEYILNKLKANGIEKTNSRELLRMCRKFKSISQMSEPLRLLTDNGFIRQIKDSGGLIYEVNPLSSQEKMSA